MIWYARNTDGTYSAKGFADATPKDAAWHVAQSLADEHLFDHSGLDTSAPNPVPEPETIAHGLALDDPLQPIADQLDPEVMELIVAAGAEGVKDLSAKAVDKDNPNFSKLDKELHVAAVAVEVALTGKWSSTTIAQVAASGNAFASTTRCSTIPGPWTFTGLTARGICTYSGSTIEICITGTANGGYTTTTTTTLATSAKNCPSSDGTTCPPRPSC